MKFAIAENSKVSIKTENEIEWIDPYEIDYYRMFNGPLTKKKQKCNFTLKFEIG